MEQHPDFNIAQFEHRVDRLLSAYRQLREDYDRLLAQQQADAENRNVLRERLNSVIERIRALEAEADSV